MHRRRRTALTLSAALAAAVPLLSACGSEARPGAAAVVGGERIEVSAVQARAAEVREAQERSPQAAELLKGSGQLSRAKLYDLIVDRVVARAAEDAGVSVTRKEVEDGRTTLAQQVGGEKPLAAAYLQQRGVAPDRLGDVIRREILVGKLAEHINAAHAHKDEKGHSHDGEKELNKAFTTAARSLDIDVNPRYGVWNSNNLELGEYKTPWITQLTRPVPTPETA